jgi:replication factor C large subunit
LQWTAKYAPRTSKDLIGNKSSYFKLKAWLKSFYNIGIKETKDFKPITLLIGPPGIGKTSGIIALANELNYEIIEFNASDQRNAKVIVSLVGRASRTKQNPGFDGRIVLLDEVDGIHGNEDRGGLASLMKVAKESFHPIICTANDPNSSKMRNFKKSVSVSTLTFKKPDMNEVVGLLEKIVKNEKLLVSTKVLKVIANNSKGDIRGSINDLENLAQNRKEIPIAAIHALSIRDTDTSIDIALSQIFGEAKTLRQAHEITSDLDVDYSMFMNYVTENISSHAGNSTELKNMYSYGSLSNLFYTRIIFSQYWTYLKYCYFFLSAGIRASKKTPYVKSYPKFPSLLMDLSRTKKVRDLRNIVTGKLGTITHSSQNKTADTTLPYVRLLFEQVFNLFIQKQLDTEKGKALLTTLAEIQNEAEFTEDEFLYLFNDPMFEKPTKTVEKKQKAVIILIEAKASELRVQHVQEFSEELSKKRRESFIDRHDNKTRHQAGIKENQEKTKIRTRAEKPQMETKAKTKNKDSLEKKTKTSITKSNEDGKVKGGKRKKSTTLLNFTETTESNKKKRKKKPSKNLSDFV